MPLSAKWATLAVAAASMLPLIGPASARAQITDKTVNGNTLTVKADGDPDPITLTAVSDLGLLVIAVNGVATTLPANDNAEVVVESGAGNDTVDAEPLVAANYKSLVVNGGDGNDSITGGADSDVLNGELGSDDLVGFKGGDTVSGSDGNDTMTWNNGDGSDVNNGEAGLDESVVNGSTTEGDVFSFQPEGALSRVLFKRLNLGPFSVNLDAERLTLNGGGGEDRMAPDVAASTGLAARTALTLNGGEANDDLTGGDGDDVVTGGAGDDHIVGFKGGDTVAGGEGDDVMVWNNGDGSDHDAGQAGFDRAEVNGAPAAGDVFNLAPEGSNAKFERTNFGPFSVTLDNPANPAEVDGGTESIAVNGGGGSDLFSVLSGLGRLLVASDGGAGNDVLLGSEEADSFFGGSGEDSLLPGDGSDLADGQEGNDSLVTRDKTGDLVRGGAGRDSAVTDAITVDAVDGVEILEATPTPVVLPPPVVAPPKPPVVDSVAEPVILGKATVAARGKGLTAKVPVSCPATETGGCSATLTLQTAKAIGLGPIRAVLVLGSKSVKLGPGGKATVAVRLVPNAALLATNSKLAIRILSSTSDAAGNTTAGTSTVTLKVPRRE
jgi:Ca2+-binding RTX toxin-like protein